MKRLLGLLIAFFFTLLAALGVAGYYLWNSLSVSHAHGKSEEIISVSRGQSTDHVISTLEQEGILESKLPLRLYLKLQKPSLVVRTGDYRFPSPVTPLQVLEILARGGEEHGRLTVVEGWTIFDIARAMAAIPSLKISEKEALALLKETSSIKDIDPGAANLEGYLFPDTYFVQLDTTAPELVRSMVSRFKSVWSKHLEKTARAASIPAHQVVTAASVIETEAKLASERPLVASVIYNRLRKGIKLSMDSTVVYASKLAGKWKDDGIVYKSDLDLNSPYNTRKFRGLPPGPVGNPGLSSLKAALAPASTNYLYYVRDPDRNDGAHSFFANSSDFDKAVKKLRDWEEQQRKAGLR